MLDLRETAKFEEAKLRSREDQAFRVRSRRNGLLGLWLADRLGLGEKAAAACAKRIASASVDHPADEALARWIARLAASAGVSLDEHTIRAEIDRLGVVAALEQGPAALPAAKAA